MKTLNKFLQKQIVKYFGSLEYLPDELLPFFKVISETYDHNDRDRKLMERSIEISSLELESLNRNLQMETEEHSRLLFEKLNESLSLLNDERSTMSGSMTDYYLRLTEIAELLKQETIKRKITEEELQKQKAHLEATQQIANIGSWEYDFSTELCTWSSETCKIYGMPTNENILSLDAWAKFIHPDDLSLFNQIFDRNNNPLIGHSYYYRVIRKDGSERFTYCQHKAILNSENAFVGLHGVSHDITEVKVIQNALTQSQHNLNMILNLIPQAIFAKNIDGKFLFANKSYASIYGLKPEEIIDRYISDIIHEKNNLSSMLKDDKDVIYSGEFKLIPDQTIYNH
jgi:PAS domain S-box-containing protein